MTGGTWFRFQMDAELRYEIAVRGRHKGCQQIGRAVDITSKSLAFRTDGRPLTPACGSVFP